MTIVRESFPVGPLQCNCTVLGNTETGSGYVFDPGGHPERIMEVVASFGLKIEALVHTHAHLDHILAAAEIQNLTGASVCLHPDDRNAAVLSPLRRRPDERVLPHFVADRRPWAVARNDQRIFIQRVKPPLNRFF